MMISSDTILGLSDKNCNILQLLTQLRYMQAGMYSAQTSKCARSESPMEEVLVAPSAAVLLTYLFLRLISSLNLTEGSHHCPELFTCSFATGTASFMCLKLTSNKCVFSDKKKYIKNKKSIISIACG
jgi:hypothetical protein